MSRYLIVGGGQIGSRHLQGILKFDPQAVVEIVEPREENFARCVERAKEISTQGQLVHHRDLASLDLNQRFQALFHCTWASERATTCEKLVPVLRQSSPECLYVLEKVLASSLTDIDRIESCFDQLPAFVNTPRRTYPFYQDWKKKNPAKGERHYQVDGMNWNLLSNSVHFLDLVSWLQDSPQDSISTQFEKMIPSKHAQFQEALGTLNGRLKDGSTLELKSAPQDGPKPYPMKITISNASGKVVIQEGVDFSPPNQSQLTTELIEHWVAKQYCNLPALSESANLHEVYLRGIGKYQIT